MKIILHRICFGGCHLKFLELRSCVIISGFTYVVQFPHQVFNLSNPQLTINLEVFPFYGISLHAIFGRCCVTFAIKHFRIKILIWNFFVCLLLFQMMFVLLVLLSMLVSTAFTIRVDFNTNTGPIRPPTTTPIPSPQPPFREPAPVWEDQSNDIPNPDPYRQVII